MQRALNLQDLFLNAAREDRVPATLFLMKGFQLKGTETGNDSFVVVIESEGRQQMIYKHAISTLVPQHGVDLYAPREERAAE